MKYHLIFLFSLIIFPFCQAQKENGFSNLNELFAEFPKVLMSENQNEMKAFIQKLLPDDATIAYLKKNDLSYRNIVEGVEKNPKALQQFRKKYLEKMLKFQAKLKRKDQLKNLTFDKMENKEIAILFPPLNVEATETIIFLKHGDDKIKCKLGELLKFDKHWKCYTSPKF